MDFELTGKRILITGAAQGIGAACARVLAAAGASLALWDTNAAAGQALLQELNTAAASRPTNSKPANPNAQFAFFTCDVSQSEQVSKAMSASMAALGRLDGLVNNAGIFKAADFLDVTEADWDAVIAVNLKGSFLVGQAAARHMAAAGRGAIVNMSSVNAVMAIPTIASYNASKGAINQLTRAMALSLAPKGVRVNAVAPGTIATELARAAVLTSEQAKARIMSRTPLGRLGEPEEIAQVVAFLLSEASSYMTGEIVAVDGGRLALNYTMPA